MVERYSKSIARRTLSNLPKVTPKDARVNNNEAQAWGQVAQTGRALFTQFAQYAREDAKTKAINNAEGVEFERNDAGITLKPPPMEEGGTIYQETYKSVVGDMYKREIKTDIESRLSKIYSTNLRDPEVMSSKLETSLGAIIENVAPQNQQEMTRIGRGYIDAYEKSAYSQRENFIFNQKIVSMQNEEQTLIDTILSTNDPIMLEQNANRLNENLQNQVKIGVIHPRDAETAQNTLGYLQSFKTLQGVLSGRSEIDNKLTNDPSLYIEIAEMLKGWGGKLGGSVDIEDEDGNVITYTTESLQKLIPVPALRVKMAQELTNRAKALSVGEGLNAQEKANIKLANNYFKLRNQGDFNDPTVTDKQKEIFWFKSLDGAIKEMNILGMDGLNTLIPDIAKLTTVEAVNIISGFSTLMKETGYLPEPAIGLLNNIGSATGDELANFYVPFYNVIKNDEVLEQLFLDNKDIDIKTRGKLAFLESIADLDGDPKNNKRIFNEIAIMLKDATEINLTKNLEFILGDSLNKDSKGMPLAGANLPFRYMVSYITKNQQALDVNLQSFSSPDFKALVFKQMTSYLTEFNGEFTAKDVNKAIELGVKKAMAGTTTFETHGVGGRDQIDNWESHSQPFLTVTPKDMQRIMPNNTEVNQIIAVQNNAEEFGADKNTAVLGYYAKKILETQLETEMPIFDQDINIRSAEESYIGVFKSEDIMGALGGLAGDKDLYDSEMGENISINYRGKNIALIYGKTFFFDKRDGTNDYAMILIDDTGAANTVTGVVQDAEGKEILFNIAALSQKQKAEAGIVQDVLDLENRLLELDEAIRAEEQTYTNIDPISSRGNADPISNRVPFGNQKTRQKALNELERNKKKVDALKKELLTRGFTTKEIKKETVVPNKKMVTTPLTTGESIVKTVSDIVANILPAGNAENTSMFMQRISRTESDHGLNKDTYVGSNNDLGVWQNKSELKEIQNKIKTQEGGGILFDNIAVMEKGIQEYIPKFSIAKLTEEDLKIPLVSAVIARLIFSYKTSEPIPKSLEEQAEYWKEYYNTPLGKGTVADFISKNFIELGM
tara:strand:- start:2410 stop:5601 length:3192 start_codon:yes stop_codon:yes gene_type:complete